MNPKRTLELLGRLALLRFFPAGNEAVMEALMVLVGAMCETEDQVRWLVERMTSGIYAEWPGPQEMRACYCSRFRPRDGINAYSQVYPDGLPPSRPLLAAPIAPIRALITGPEAPTPFAQDVEARKRRVKIAQVSPDYKPITQADVDAAVLAYRATRQIP
jgi:hypothetical protein